MLADLVVRRQHPPARGALWLAAAVLCGSWWPAAAAEAPPSKRLKTYPTRYYILHTDLGEDVVREAAARMTAMAEEYHSRTRGFAGVIQHRFPFYLYSNEKDYHDGGGIKGSAGIYDGERQVLMALAQEGVTDDRLWHVVQHEGFHQFAQNVIGGRLPIWINEGLAEYFAQGIWTGDDFVTGVIPPYRLRLVQGYIRDGKIVSFLEMLLKTSAEWSGAVEDSARKREERRKKENEGDPFAKDPDAPGDGGTKKVDEEERVQVLYHQAWSMVHFLVHAENGKYREPLASLIRDTSRGADWQLSFQARFGRNVKPFEKRYSDWWLAQEPHATQDLYIQAVVQTLTSFLARAVSQGQKFADVEEFLREARAGNLKCHKDQWLPSRLREETLLAARNWQRAWSFQTAGRFPWLVLTWPDGKVYTGTYTCSAGKAGNVKVAVTEKKPS